MEPVPLAGKPTIIPARGAAYIWDCRTWEPYWRQGYFTRILVDALRRSRHRAFIAVEEENTASIGAIEGTGLFHFHQRYRVWRCRNLSLPFTVRIND